VELDRGGSVDRCKKLNIWKSKGMASLPLRHLSIVKCPLCFGDSEEGDVITVAHTYASTLAIFVRGHLGRDLI
jgi:hypothetical protein